MNEDHITISNTPDLPISIGDFLGAMKEFRERHLHCRPKAEAADGN